jgi:hypothetical protein
MNPFIFSLPYRSLTPTGQTWEIDGAANDLCLRLGSQFLYAFNCHYQNGRTYHSIRRNHISSDNRAGMIEYYNGDVNFEIFGENPSAIDYHDECTFQIDSTGIITLIQGQHFGVDDYNDVWKMSTPYDITSFSRQTDAPNDSGNYPKFYRVSDNSYFMIGRVLTKSDDPKEFDIYFTTYNGSTWGTPIKMIDVDPEDSKQVTLYPNGLFDASGQQDDWHYFRWVKRLEIDPVINYRDRYLAKCHKDDIHTWYNLEETFSKNISVSHITETEANANYRYDIDAVSGIRDNVARNVLYNGDMSLIESVDGSYTLNELKNKVWQTPQILTTQSPSVLCLLRPKNDLYVGFMLDENNDIYKYESNDLLTFTKKDFIYSHADGIETVHMPHNFSKIPKGEKFALFASTNKYNSGTGDSIVDSPNSNDYIVIEIIK